MKPGKKIVALIGVLLFAVILASVDLSKVIAILFGISLPLYFFSMLVLCIMVIFKGLKWKLVLKSQGKELPLEEATRIYLIGLFISNITPGKIGDFAKSFYLKDRVGLTTGIASIILDRLMDVGILVGFAAVASISFIYLYNVTVIPISIVLLLSLAFALAVIFLFREKYVKMLLRPVFKLVVPERHRTGISVGFSEVFASVKSIRARPLIFFFSLALGCVIWLLSALFLYLLSTALSIGVPIGVILLAFPLMSLADLLPISFSGIGTREAVLIFIFSLFSISPESAVALSTLVFFSGYVPVSFIGMLLFASRPISLDFG